MDSLIIRNFSEKILIFILTIILINNFSIEEKCIITFIILFLVEKYNKISSDSKRMSIFSVEN